MLKCNNCTLEEQAIINILKANPRATQKEIANQINKSIRTVKTYMAEMQEKGLIKRKNGKKNGEWQVNVQNISDILYKIYRMVINMDQTRLNRELYNEFKKEVLNEGKIIELIKKVLIYLKICQLIRMLKKHAKK